MVGLPVSLNMCNNYLTKRRAIYTLSGNNRVFISIFLIIILLTSVVGDDFYDRLKVSKSATEKEIRKAFKKLALTMHPDKNQDDPSAHDKFLEITQAYEVLKDDDLRKKYDEYGEEGLKEDYNRWHGRYESWNFYHEQFGIYDDDPLIITLSHIDFEQSVQGTSDIWFINFYSPHCSHCHLMAPTWREVSQQLEGVVRIGAVNCEDARQLCHQMGIHSFPTLTVFAFPQRYKYEGDRGTESLVAYGLSVVKAKVHKLRASNFQSTMTKADSNIPWIITYCGDGGDCLSESSCIKLAAMLEGLCNVGSVECYTNANLCEQMDIPYGTFYYKAGTVKAGTGTEVTSLIPKEVALEVLAELPDVNVLDEATFRSIRKKLRDGTENAWLIQFVEGNDVDLELRKLPAMLSDINFGRVDCTQMSDICRSKLHIHSFPTFAVFKQTGGYEMYYGRATAHDIAVFAKDSSATAVEVLSPTDFPERVIRKRDPWFVDFFSPLCPPCMKLLPEFRKAAKDFGPTVNFGTVDCTVHRQLCNNYKIQSYPTTIFYNQSVPHHYHGHHSAHHIVDFLHDTLNPPVISLNPDLYDKFIRQKSKDEMWLVDYFAPWCGPCQQLAPEWRTLAKLVKHMTNIHVAQVDCQEHRPLCLQAGVQSYPTMHLYPMGSTSPAKFHLYNGWNRDAQSLRAWVFDFLPTKVETLTAQNFYDKVLRGSIPWVVDFYTPWCGHCQVFKPEFEKVAEQVEGIAKAGKVNCDQEQWLCHDASVRSYPSVRFYKQASPGRQDYRGVDINSQNADVVVQFIKQSVPVKATKQIRDEF